MQDSELPQEVRHLIQTSIPSVDALEILIGLVQKAPTAMTAETLSTALRPSVVPVAVISEFLRLLRSQGMITGEPKDGFVYRPASAEQDRAVRGLVRAYNERPVTLIRTVYALADQKRIQAFSDAFRLKKEE